MRAGPIGRPDLRGDRRGRQGRTTVIEVDASAMVEALVGRARRLRHRFTSYDACYLALAAALDVPRLTFDSKLNRTGHGADIAVVSRAH